MTRQMGLLMVFAASALATRAHDLVDVFDGAVAVLL
jgi:hypothetical protein